MNDRTVRLIEPAEMPGAPVFPDRTGNLQMALVVGLVTGVLLVAAKERLDTTLKTPDDIREALQVAFLGFVPDLTTLGEAVAKPNLNALRHPASPLSEAYRVIRTNVMASARAGGGEGSTHHEHPPGRGEIDDGPESGRSHCPDRRHRRSGRFRPPAAHRPLQPGSAAQSGCPRRALPQRGLSRCGATGSNRGVVGAHLRGDPG